MSFDLDTVEHYATQAEGIAFDGCHKIYVLMDDEQVEQMRGYDYGKNGSLLITRAEQSPAEMARTLQDWFETSCSLKFIEAVSTGTEDTVFETIIGQGDWLDEEDED